MIRGRDLDLEPGQHVLSDLECRLGLAEFGTLHINFVHTLERGKEIQIKHAYIHTYTDICYRERVFVIALNLTIAREK